MKKQELIILRILLKKAIDIVEKQNLQDVTKSYKKALFYSDEKFVEKVLVSE